MEDASIPHLKEPVDILRNGPTSLAVEAAAPHPIQAFQATRSEREFSSRLDSVTRLYGVAAAMRLKTEKEILSRIRRPPGMPSSFVALETALGKDETIEFEDILNDPLEKPDVRPFRLHDKMEVQLGL